MCWCGRSKCRATARRPRARRRELRAAARALPSADDLFALPRQRLDHAATRLPRALIANAQSHHAHFSRAAGRLAPQALRTRIVNERLRIAMLALRSTHCL